MQTTMATIDIKLISPCPKNPRKHMDPKKLQELADSIKQKGVIEPIIVRPAGKGFEIVAGERRFKAAGLAGLETIPAIVRDLTDDEAYDFMLIENLQREDLTEREEAESFKVYVGRHKEDGIPALAEKTGISPGYIRSRIRVLELPVKVLKAWNEGKLVFGHLQQLVRIQDKVELGETINCLFSWDMTVRKLAAHIDEKAPALSAAFFPAKEACAGCGSSSIVQKDLFDVDADKARCLNPVCFKKHQNDYLNGHWKETALAKKHGTNGFRFAEGLSYNDTHHFGYGDKPGAKCKSCPEFVTVIELSGKVQLEKVCAGKGPCFNAVTNPKSAKEKATGERDPEAPRAAWHGEYFRDVFLSKRIPEELAKLDPENPKIKALLFACAIHGNRFTVDQGRSASAGFLAKPVAEYRKAFKTVIEQVILSGQHVGESEHNGFGTKGRRLVAEYLGIDLAKEYTVDKDYLDKKTRAEILAFLKKFNLGSRFGDLETAAKLKKTELIKGILGLGDKLVGKVPAEILK